MDEIKLKAMETRNYEELYHTMKSRPLLTEVLKVLFEAKEPVALTEISETLHKKMPTLHKVLRDLEETKLIEGKREGRTKKYSVLPKNRDTIHRLLKLLYFPTKKFILGEFRKAFPGAILEENKKVKGKHFEHLIHFQVSYREGLRQPEEKGRVGVIILENPSEDKILEIAGRACDLRLPCLAIIMIEDGVAEEQYEIYEKYLEDAGVELIPFLIRKKSPLSDIKGIIDYLENYLGGL